MEKLYNRIDWHNNTSPDINETNLNRMSKAIDDIDDRVIAIGGDVLEVIPQIQSYLEQADDLVEALELMTANPPYIGANGHWYVWDTETGAYVDSNIDASITVQISAITMLDPDATPYVENEGTDTDPIFHLYIPRGQTGAAGQDGVSPTVTISTITGGHRITITDKDHPSGQSFDVMDGASGGVTSFNGRTGTVTPQSGDYTASDVGAVASNGGEAGDTIVTFTDPSADGNITSGSALKTIIGLIKYKLSHITGGGHTILNSSGTAMNQRGKLQFDGATVTDDSVNDKTIVTGTPQSMIGDEWASGQSYAVGDYRIDGNVLYKCKTAHTSSASNRPPYVSYWEPRSVADELVSAFADISNLKYMVYGAVIDGSYFNSLIFGGWIASGQWSIYLSGDSWYTKRTNNGQTGDAPQTINYVDMTGYSRITLELGTVSDTSGAFAVVFIYEDGSTTSTVLNTGTPPYQQNHTYTADISSINKKARIGFSYYGYITVQIKKLYLT